MRKSTKGLVLSEVTMLPKIIDDLTRPEPAKFRVFSSQHSFKQNSPNENLISFPLKL